MDEFGSADNLTPDQIIAELDKKLKEWNTVPVNIAVVGNTGVGKSTFVNAFLGLKRKDPRAAKVGVVECTKEISKYPHPNNDKLIFWDVPGIGSQAFPAETYREKVNMIEYDFFVVMSSQRFTENDVKLSNMIKEMGKNFFFVRSQVDVDIYKQAKENDQSPEDVEESVMRTLREDIESRLKKLGMNDQKHFLVDNYSVDKYDFGDLFDATQSRLDEMQKTAVAFSCTHLTSKSLIEKRVKILKERIPLIATKCGLVLLDSSRNEVVYDEVCMYRTQLGLDIKQKYMLASGKENTLVKRIVRQIGGTVQAQSIAFIYKLCARFKSNVKYEQAKCRLEKELKSAHDEATENTRKLYTLVAGKTKS
ncbi:interferon-inducible GTPase 1-like [Mya arenaria]|uniref:interferon-inducible GTPase 1-like n=1 Tax=Mya arenaria TaxID=6604 RepID=UPI0022DF86B9|nr:interferon-inducible GTPase 1-like [Mya arenaria]